jgi:hypothetical protein
VPVAQACNPIYSRGRDQEDRGSKPAKLITPKQKKKKKKKSQKGLVEWLSVGLEFKHQYRKNKKVIKVYHSFFVFANGFELRTLSLKSRYSTTQVTPSVHFALVI